MRLERAVGYGALASSAVFVAHAFGYLIAYSSSGDRSVALAGHAYFGPAAWAVIPLASLIIAAVVIRAATRTATTSFRPWAVATVAMAGFLVLEVVERIPTGEPHAAFIEPGVLAGLALSLPVGCVLAKLARGLEHIAAAIVNALARRWPRPAVLVVPTVASTVAIGEFFGLLPSPRGPPHLRVLTI